MSKTGLKCGADMKLIWHYKVVPVSNKQTKEMYQCGMSTPSRSMITITDNISRHKILEFHPKA